MRFLLDANLSPRLASALTEAGFDTRHVADLDLLTAANEDIFRRGAADGFVVITADTDFTMLLAARRAATPSVVLLRHVAELHSAAHLALLLATCQPCYWTSRQAPWRRSAQPGSPCGGYRSPNPSPAQAVGVAS